MSKLRQSRPILRALSLRYESGSRLPSHRHAWGQLVYASEGVMTVGTPQGTWVVPPQRAVWIPPETLHSVETSGTVAMRTLYLPAPRVRGLLRTCAVVPVSALLRELILHAVERAPLRADEPRDARLLRFLLDHVETLPTAPLSLPMPRDPRAVRAATALRAAPGAAHGLCELARAAGASRRTLERLFRRETGLSLGRWRQQLRLLEALRLLAAGHPVASVASQVGYASPSAFVTRFRSALGTTPSRYHAAVDASRG